jgi:hypothetical protein
LLGWSPKAPIALCGGEDDPTVYFSNTTSMQTDFATRGIAVREAGGRRARSAGFHRPHSSSGH